MKSPSAALTIDPKTTTIANTQENFQPHLLVGGVAALNVPFVTYNSTV